MATKQVVRELVTLWGFDIDQQPLKEVNAGINVIKQSLKTLAVAVAGSAAAVGFLLNEVGEDEQTRIAFETMLGSAEAMEQKLKELEAFAVRTPFTLKGIKVNSKLLLGMGIEAEKLLPTLKFLGDVSSGLSVPLQRLALNFGQVRNQNKLTGRELRDFAVAGVPLLDELAKNLGKTTKEIAAMVSKGEIGFADVEKAFISMTSGSGRFADLMTKQSKSFFGLMSNIQDILQLLARDLGNELLPAAKEIAKAFMDILEVNRQLILQNLGVFIKNLAGFMLTLFDIIMTVFRAMTGIVKIFGGWNKVLGITFKLIAAIIGLGLTLGIGLITKALIAMTVALWASAAGFAANVAASSALLGLPLALAAEFVILGNSALVAQAKLLAIPLALGAIVAAVALIAEDIFAFSEGRDSVFGRMVTGMDTAFGALKEKFGFFGNFLNLFLAGILLPVRHIVAAFKTVGTLIDVISGKKSILDGLKDVGRHALSTIAPLAGGSSARGLFGLSEQAGQAGEQVESGSAAGIKGLGGNPFKKGQGGQKSVSVASKNEITLNVAGMDPKAAQDLVTLTLGDELDAILRGAVRDGESNIER